MSFQVLSKKTIKKTLAFWANDHHTILASRNGLLSFWSSAPVRAKLLLGILEISENVILQKISKLMSSSTWYEDEDRIYLKSKTFWYINWLFIHQPHQLEIRKSLAPERKRWDGRSLESTLRQRQPGPNTGARDRVFQDVSLRNSCWS